MAKRGTERRGRPPRRGAPASRRLQLRLTDGEYEALVRAASAADAASLTDFARLLLMGEVEDAEPTSVRDTLRQIGLLTVRAIRESEKSQ